MVAEEVLRCPKCSDRLIPQLLDINVQGEQNVWWVCASMNENPKSCNFPLAMPPDVFWVKRSAKEIRMNIIPRPRMSKLPKKYRYLYPGIFSSTESSRSSHSSSLRSKKRKALTRSDGISAGSSDSGHRPLTPIISSERLLDVTQKEVTPVANASLDNSACMIEEMTETPSTSFATVAEPPQRCVSPGIGELFAAPPQSSKKGVVEIFGQANVSTTDDRIAKDAKKLEKHLHQPLNTLQQRNGPQKRQTKTLTLAAPTPFILKATTPFEKAKAALTLMHSAPTEIPESFVQASRKLAVVGGYKQRISQWNRNSAVDHLRSERRFKPRKLIKRSRGYPDNMANNADEMELPKPDEENMQRIEMEVRHRLTAKMMQYGYGDGKAVDEMNYLMGKEYGEQSMASQTSEPSNSQEQQLESMQSVKNEEAIEQMEHENWFNEIDNLDLPGYGEESNSNHWSTLTQASTSATEIFNGAFEDPTTNYDQFDDLYAWNHM